MTAPASSLRRACVVFLDSLVIGAGSAALVCLLGARTRFLIGATRVTVQSPVNLFIATGVLLALRLLLAGRAPLLGIARHPTADARDLERFAEPPAATREVRLLALACTLGSSVWLIPHITHLRRVPDAADPVFSAWRIARIAHQLTADPRHLFDGNIFFPNRLTMTNSDATLLQGFIGAPFVWAGVDPLVVSNAVFLLAFPACGLAFFYAAWRLTTDPRAALIGGLLGAWLPFHGEHYSHLELQFFMFVPLALVLLLRILAAPGWRTGVAFGIAVALQRLASMYISVMVVTVLVPFAALVAIAWRVAPSRQLLSASAIAAVVSLGVIIPTSLPYLQTRQARGDRTREDVAQGSALPSDYGQPHGRLTNYFWISQEGSHIERQLFPGISTLVLTGAGIVPPLTVPAIALTTCAALAFDWSLGLNGLTYDALYRFLTPYRGMRVAARFNALLGSILALLGACGARRLIVLARNRTAQSAVTTALALLVLFDLRLGLLLRDYYPTIPTIYQRVTPRDVLAEFPVDRDIDYMYFSTRHWAQLLGGYSGFVSYKPPLLEAWRTFPSPSSVAILRGLGATHLTYNCGLEQLPRLCERTIKALDANPALRLIASERWNDGDVRLYQYVDSR